MMISCPVNETSQTAEARRNAVGLATAHGFDEEDVGRVALVATELSTNLIKHGGGGHLLAGTFEAPDGSSGIEILALDKGPGIRNIDTALQDGVSTAGSAGNGMGAIRRLSDGFEIFSQLGHGTAVLARLTPRQMHLMKARPAPAIAVGAVCVPYPGEEVSGDSWAVRSDEDGLTLMVADGLGHGPLAAEAAVKASELFGKYWHEPPVAVLERMHAALRATRGAAVAIARLDYRRSCVTFAGVGNIAGTLVTAEGASRRMLSHNGTLGHVARKFQAIDYAVDDLSRIQVVLHSDGVSVNWTLSNYPGLALAHPGLIAAVLYRDFARGRDDATVLVARGKAS